MTWSMAKFQWHGACCSEHKSRTWLGQWPMFNGMEHGVQNTRAVHGLVNGQVSMAWSMALRTHELYMAWPMAKFQCHEAWCSEHKSRTWLCQWPMFNGMEHGVQNTRAVHGLVNGQASMAWSMALRTHELYMAWSMAKFQWHGTLSSEQKSLT